MESPYGAPYLAFIGKAGAGKSTAAKFLRDTYNYQPLSFATPLKEISVKLWGEEAYQDRDKLQRLGVSIREIDPDTFPRYLSRTVHASYEENPGRPFTVDDCRFPNEVAHLLADGFVIVRLHVPRRMQQARLTANGKWQNEAQLDHITETALDDYPADYEYVNDLGVERLYDFLTSVIQKEMNR